MHQRLFKPQHAARESRAARQALAPSVRDASREPPDPRPAPWRATSGLLVLAAHTLTGAIPQAIAASGHLPPIWTSRAPANLSPASAVPQETLRNQVRPATGTVGRRPSALVHDLSLDFCNLASLGIEPVYSPMKP